MDNADNPDEDNAQEDDNDDDDDRMSLVSSSEDTQSDSDSPRNRRRPFDLTLPPTHQYLQLNGHEESSVGLKFEDPGKVITVSVLELPIVLLPTQRLPFHTDYPLLVSQLQQAVRNNEYIALVPRINAASSSTATLIQVNSIRDDDGDITVQAIGKQRCKMLSRRVSSSGMMCGEVEVLADVTLPNFTQIFSPNSFSRNRLSKNFRYYAAMTAHSNYALKISVTKHYLDQLVNWLIRWHAYDKVKAVLDQGPSSFSYWVAANLPIDMETRMTLLDESCTDRRLVLEVNIVKTIDVIVCKSCGTALCKMENMINVSVEGNSAHYVNPGGYVHDLFTVSEVSGTRSHGHPSSEYSWFTGYKWTMQECSRCGQHVGWRFTSRVLTPRSFYGLTRGAIRPADSRHPNQADNPQRIEELSIV